MVKSSNLSFPIGVKRMEKNIRVSNRARGQTRSKVSLEIIISFLVHLTQGNGFGMIALCVLFSFLLFFFSVPFFFLPVLWLFLFLSTFSLWSTFSSTQHSLQPYSCQHSLQQGYGFLAGFVHWACIYDYWSGGI
jgi:hypothetical protein